MKSVREASRFGSDGGPSSGARGSPGDESTPLPSVLGYDEQPIRVLGGVAWTQRPTTLTGESPTSSAAGSRPCSGNANL